MSGLDDLVNSVRGSSKGTWLIVIARLSLLLMAAALAASAFALAWSEEPATARTAPRYGCPMHPEVTSATAGECSICHMALVELDEDAANSHASKPGASAANRYVCPMHPEVSSPVPGDCSICRMALERVEPSHAAPASQKSAMASTFSIDHAGTSARGYVPETPRRRMLRRDVVAPAWVEADGRVAALLYRDEHAGLAPGSQGAFFQARAPNAAIAARLTEQAPVAWDEATLKVHFRLEPSTAVPLDGQAQALPEPLAGAPGWVRLPERVEELVMVPSRAVLRSAEGPYVLVAEEQSLHFSKRHLEIGQVLDGHVAVHSGLREDERVVVQGAFFVDAERRRQVERERVLAKAP